MKRMVSAPCLYYLYPCSCILHQCFTLSLKRTVICILANNNFLRFCKHWFNWELPCFFCGCCWLWCPWQHSWLSKELSRQFLGWCDPRWGGSQYLPQYYKKYTKDSRTLPTLCKLNVHVHQSNTATGVYPLPLLLFILWSLTSQQNAARLCHEQQLQ